MLRRTLERYFCCLVIRCKMQACPLVSGLRRIPHGTFESILNSLAYHIKSVSGHRGSAPDYRRVCESAVERNALHFSLVKALIQFQHFLGCKATQGNVRCQLCSAAGRQVRGDAVAGAAVRVPLPG